MNKALPPFLLLLFIPHLSFAADTEGGNVSSANLTANGSTEYWAGIVGTMNTAAPSDPSQPISYQDVGGVNVSDNSPNGTYTNISLVVTRLPDRPSASGISSPSSSDFASGGMFANFTAFAELDFTSFSDSPLFTFGAASLMNCTIGGATYDCPYITLLPGTRMGVLKFSNATRNEPLFITVIESQPGYNGSYFDFEFMVPRSESYYFYVYPPPVVVIITPQPITYSTGSIPFTYTITAYSGLNSCWYVLDGTRVDMPDCTIAYILNVGGSTHTLTLYANDTANQTGSGSVTFTVQATPPTPPPGPTGGPGVAHIPQPQPPVIPPAYDQFEIQPENIWITIDYPLPGEADFSLYSFNSLVDVECFVEGDFEEYTVVELESDEIPAGGTIRGTITVSMPPEDILNYFRDTEGLLQCVGRRDMNSSLMLSTTANVYLQINRPAVDVENVTVEMAAVDIILGEGKFANLTLTNMGNGSAFFYNMSAEFMGPYGNLIQLISVPRLLQHNEVGTLSFFVSIPRDFAPGIYSIPVFIYENGRIVGRGQVTLFVKEPIGVTICVFPDLRWTVIILLAGMLAAIFLYREGEKEGSRPAAYARQQASTRPASGILRPLAAGLLSLAVWAIIIWLLGKCT